MASEKKGMTFGDIGTLFSSTSFKMASQLPTPVGATSTNSPVVANHDSPIPLSVGQPSASPHHLNFDSLSHATLVDILRELSKDHTIQMQIEEIIKKHRSKTSTMKQPTKSITESSKNAPQPSSSKAKPPTDNKQTTKKPTTTTVTSKTATNSSLKSNTTKNNTVNANTASKPQKPANSVSKSNPTQTKPNAKNLTSNKSTTQPTQSQTDKKSASHDVTKVDQKDPLEPINPTATPQKHVTPTKSNTPSKSGEKVTPSKSTPTSVKPTPTSVKPTPNKSNSSKTTPSKPTEHQAETPVKQSSTPQATTPAKTDSPKPISSKPTPSKIVAHPATPSKVVDSAKPQTPTHSKPTEQQNATPAPPVQPQIAKQDSTAPVQSNISKSEAVQVQSVQQVKVANASEIEEEKKRHQDLEASLNQSQQSFDEHLQQLSSQLDVQKFPNLSMQPPKKLDDADDEDDTQMLHASHEQQLKIEHVDPSNLIQLDAFKLQIPQEQPNHENHISQPLNTTSTPVVVNSAAPTTNAVHSEQEEF